MSGVQLSHELSSSVRVCARDAHGDAMPRAVDQQIFRSANQGHREQGPRGFDLRKRGVECKVEGMRGYLRDPHV
jgi:hypothetical protein